MNKNENKCLDTAKNILLVLSSLSVLVSDAYARESGERGYKDRSEDGRRSIQRRSNALSQRTESSREVENQTEKPLTARERNRELSDKIAEKYGLEKYRTPRVDPVARQSALEAPLPRASINHLERSSRQFAEETRLEKERQALRQRNADNRRSVSTRVTAPQLEANSRDLAENARRVREKVALKNDRIDREAQAVIQSGSNLIGRTVDTGYDIISQSLAHQKVPALNQPSDEENPEEKENVSNRKQEPSSLGEALSEYIRTSLGFFYGCL